MSIHQSNDSMLSQLNERLREFSTATILFHQTIADKLGLNATDHKCLNVIIENHPLTAGHLADLTGYTTGTVTGVIDRLEKAGYVYRAQDPQDRRRVIIGVHMDKVSHDVFPIFQSLRNTVDQYFKNYTEPEIRFALEFITRCLSIMDEETKKLKS